MRFREQQIILERNLNIIKNTIPSTSLISNEIPQSVVKVNTKILDALEDLKKLKYFSKDIAKLQELGLKKENIILEDIKIKNSKLIYNGLKNLRNKIKVIIESLSLSLPEERSNSLVIGLRQDSVDFDGIIKVQKDIFRTLSLILNTNEKVDKKIDVSNFDSGSLWIEIAFGSAFAVKFVADVISIVYTAKAMSKQNKLFERRMEELEFQESTKREIKDVLANAFITDIKNQLDEYSNNSENGVNRDPETFSRLCTGAKELFELIDSGNTFEITEKSISEGIKQIPKNGEMIEELKKLEHVQDTTEE